MNPEEKKENKRISNTPFYRAEFFKNFLSSENFFDPIENENILMQK
jgi:hypothetical protein